MEFLKPRFYPAKLPALDLVFIHAVGEDVLRFFQGQATRDINSLKEGLLGINTRLDRTGKVHFYFWFGMQNNEGLFLIQRDEAHKLKEEFDKFIIMDDVELTIVENDFDLVIGPYEREGDCEVELAGEIAKLFFEPQELEQLNKNDFEAFCRLQGWPIKQDEVRGKLINESFLNEVAVNYDKGCFLGQETAAKIQTRRGASRYPVLLETTTILQLGPLTVDGNKKIGEILHRAGDRYIASLAREWRVEGRDVNTDQGIFSVKLLPLFKEKSNREKATTLYHEGVELFQLDKEAEGRAYLERAIEIDPGLADAYEALGVLLGRHEQYEKAIELMDRLLEVEPESIMAHTNKSLYLMKLGKIEEAEEEKSKAAIKSFTRLGKETDAKKAEEEARQKQEEELKRREGMFEQVLEIDELDEVANYGMGDISLHRQQYKKAISYLNKALEANKKHSRAYLLLGKAYAGMGDLNKAKEIWQSGVSVASAQGDLMPANEMQALISKL